MGLEVAHVGIESNVVRRVRVLEEANGYEPTR
jgi:hypothetical protein